MAMESETLFVVLDARGRYLPKWKLKAIGLYLLTSIIRLTRIHWASWLKTLRRWILLKMTMELHGLECTANR